MAAVHVSTYALLTERVLDAPSANLYDIPEKTFKGPFCPKHFFHAKFQTIAQSESSLKTLF